MDTRSVPPLIESTLRRGDARTRLRLSMSLAGVVLVLTAGAAATLLIDGPPARLVFGTGETTEGVVLNYLNPVQLEMRALDKRGHELDSRGVQYQWLSGAPITISPTGVIKCAERGDVQVRASLGKATTEMAVHCRPVSEVRASRWMNLVIGDRPRDLLFTAIGLDDRPVTELRGSVHVADSSIASLEGSTIRPRAVGQTFVNVDVGDRRARIAVTVNDLVDSFEGLRADQRFVAVRVRLAQGDTVEWKLPPGRFWLSYRPPHVDAAPPTITMHGTAGCAISAGIRARRVLSDEYVAYCKVDGTGGSVSVAHGAIGQSVVEGTLSLERLDSQ